MNRGMVLVTMLVTSPACGADDETCAALVGTYVGTVSGTTPINGTLTLVVAASGTGATVNGTWNGESGHYGEAWSPEVSCPAGSVNSTYGFSLEGPASVICPAPCQPGDSEGGCYCNGATLGAFVGTFGASTASGTWSANSGAAQTIAVTGAGTWTATRQ